MDELVKDKIVMTVDDPAALTEDETVMSVEDLADLMAVDVQADTMKKISLLEADYQVDPIKEQTALMIPHWLQQMLETRFFFKCETHSDSYKGMCNRYCLDCMGHAICSHCAAGHKYHNIVQIRKLSYHNAVRVSDVSKFINISSVQPYTVNNEKVVFLNKRPHQRRLGNWVNYACKICRHSLIDSFRFCSLGCKLQGIENGDPELTFILQGKNGDPELTFTWGGNDNRMQHQGMIQSSSTSPKLQNNSAFGQIVESPTLYCSNEDGNCSNEDGNRIATGGTVQDTPPITNYRTSRRKGIPHRAPLS